MNMLRNLQTVLLMGLLAVLPVMGQPQPATLSPDLQEVEDQARQMLDKAQGPNFDFTKFQEDMRGLVQQFQEATQNMEPDQVAALRDQMFQRLQPALEKAMPNIMRGAQDGMLANLQKQLECTDDEFAVLRPLLQKVLDGMMALGGPGRGGPGGRPPIFSGPPSDLSTARNELQTLLKDPNATLNEVRQKLDAYRTAREKAKQDLASYRAQLIQLLSPRQESILASMGIVE